MNEHSLSQLIKPSSTKLNYLSLGAGVQSSTLALMAAHGEMGPMPDAAIFADTQAEPESVYLWLDWLEKQLPYPVYRVTKGSLTEKSLQVYKVKKEGGKFPIGTSYLKKIIPMFGRSPEGKLQAALGRACTGDYKINPVMAKLRSLAKIKNGQKEVTVTQWIGISYDEIQRMKQSKEPWCQHRWPLIEEKITRDQCIKWMQKMGYPEPPRSACTYCPFHSDKEWLSLKNTDKKGWESAVKFDRELREKFRNHNQMMRMDVYLHRDLKPLDEIDFKKPSDEPEFDFGSECEGMCGL